MIDVQDADEEDKLPQGWHIPEPPKLSETKL